MHKAFAARTAAYGILLLTLPVLAQDTGAPAEGDDADASATPVVINPPPPRTRLESFVARKGTLLVKGYTEIGTVPGEDGSAVKVTAVEVTDGGKQEKSFGLVIAVRSRTAREATSWVDMDEIDALAAALDNLRNMEQANVTRMQNFEATYRSKGDIELTNYDRNGARYAALRATQVAPMTGQLNWATAHFRLATLSEIRQQLTLAKDLIAKIREPLPKGD